MVHISTGDILREEVKKQSEIGIVVCIITLVLLSTSIPLLFTSLIHLNQ